MNELDTEQKIRDRFPAPRYRVSRGNYPAGAKFPFTASKGIAFVLSGACRYKGRTEQFDLKAGENAAFASGDYIFEVLGDEGVVLLEVWDIDELIRARHENASSSERRAV